MLCADEWLETKPKFSRKLSVADERSKERSFLIRKLTFEQFALMLALVILLLLLLLLLLLVVVGLVELIAEDA